jgi:lysophospholipase L1-like esterase
MFTKILGCLAALPAVMSPDFTYTGSGAADCVLDFGAPTRGNSAAIPASRGSELVGLETWTHQHQGYVDAAAKGHIDVLFVGDSITNGWEYAGGPVWEEHYGRLPAAHFGISGDQTQNVLWRVQNGELDGVQPRLIVLLIGTNNVYDNTPAEIAEGIGAILNEILNRTPRSRILLMGIFPRSRNPDDPERARIAEVNLLISAQVDALISAGRTSGEACCQFGECIISHLDIGARFLNPDGTLRDELMPDYLRPSRRGYEIWADAIAPYVLQSLLPEAPQRRRSAHHRVD